MIHLHLSHPFSPPFLLQACLTVWWVILRFMGDIPEPKSSQEQQRNTPVSSVASRYLNLRQGRRLSNLVGIDQVKWENSCTSRELPLTPDNQKQTSAISGQMVSLERRLVFTVVLSKEVAHPESLPHYRCRIIQTNSSWRVEQQHSSTEPHQELDFYKC